MKCGIENACEIISQVEQRASANGVNLDIYYEDSVLWISRIERVGPNPGSARAILLELIELAQEIGATVSGAIVPKNSRLEEYYSEVGFDLIAEEDRTIIKA